MAMNREQKRMMQRQGQVDADGAPVAQSRQPQRATKASSATEARASAPQFLREVRSELRKVNWPSRPEVIQYSIIVLIVIVVMTALIGVFDYGFGKAVLWVIER
ncbi:MAG: preprotein translocase subunit SecE [Acidimicrobiia bacterium]